jgi:hypothetical protein
MTKTTAIVFFVLSFCVAAAAQDSKGDDFPLKFRVEASKADSVACTMVLRLEPGDGHIYTVQDTGVFHCYTWPKGAIVQGRFKGRYSIDLLGKPENGKPKYYTYHIVHTRNA